MFAQSRDDCLSLGIPEKIEREECVLIWKLLRCHVQISFSRVGSDDEVGGCLNVSYVVNLQTSWKRFEFEESAAGFEEKTWVNLPLVNPQPTSNSMQPSASISTLTNPIKPSVNPKRQLHEIFSKIPNKPPASTHTNDIWIRNTAKCFQSHFGYLRTTGKGEILD